MHPGMFYTQANFAHIITQLYFLPWRKTIHKKGDIYWYSNAIG